MIPSKNEVAVQGALPGESRRMNIAAGAEAHIMAQIIALYSDPERATLRELATNAIDSHVMAGNTSPIEVQTPSPLSPFLKIRDFGLGLTVDEIFNLFGSIGASSKRGTNEATGMLGFGSKSPLAYTNQFTMTAIKDGVRATVSISRDEDGVGNLTVVDTSTTDAPNGVELTVPAKIGNSMETKALTLFKFWKPGTVLLNGRDPSGLGDDAMWVTNDIAMLKHDRYGDEQSVVVMGNVPYPAPALAADQLGLRTNYQERYSIVAYLPIGSLDFAPSREALKDTQKTRAALESVKPRFEAGLQKAIQKEIDQAASKQLALKAFLRWEQLISGRTRGRPGSGTAASFHPTWHGQPLPVKIETPHKATTDSYGRPSSSLTAKTLLVDRYTAGTRQRKGASQNRASLNADAVLNSVFVTGFDQAEPTLTMRKKMAQWASAQGGNAQIARYWVFLDWKPEMLDLVDKNRIIDWPTIKAEVLPKAAPLASGRIPGSFDLVVYDTALNHGFEQKDGVEGDKIDQTNPVYYFHGNQHSCRSTVGPILAQHSAKFTVICLPENRLAKFKRENPKIKNARDEIKGLASKIAANMTADQKVALGMLDAWDRDELKVLVGHEKKIDDPDIKRAIRLCQINIDGIVKAREQFRGMVNFPTDWTSPLDSYVLYDRSHMRRNPAHVIRYLNHEFAARQAVVGTAKVAA